MKKCPNCQKTYDDSLKFCQVDGTPLVAVAEDTPEENPYKTVVGNASDLPIPPEEKKPETTPEPEPELDPYATMVAGSKMPAPKEEDVLEVPESPVDPMATMVVSGQTSGNIEIDIPEEEVEKEEASAPPALEESEPAVPEAVAEPAVQEEPVAAPPAVEERPPFIPPVAEEKPAAPIPSPFEESMPPGFTAPTTPPFDSPESPVEPEQTRSEPEPSVQSAPVAEAEPLPSDFSDISSAADDIGEVEPALPAAASNAPLEASASEPPAAAAEGTAPNQTLAFVSLGLGIIGLPCCAFYIFGLAAIVVGFIARGKANSDPENYGGGTYATIGLVLGIVSVLLGTGLLIFQLLVGGLTSLIQ